MIALVSAGEARTADVDLAPLAAALERRALACQVVDWDDREVDWASFDAAIVRSTWDYTSRLDEFRRWIERAAEATRLFNPADVLLWNSDKHYLRALAAQGVPVIPTTFLEPGDDPLLPAGGSWVLKPAVGAGSVDCMRYDASTASEAADHARRLLSHGRSVMVQPYLHAIEREGETALIHFDGELSHAIRKGPLLMRTGKRDGAYREEISGTAATARQRAVARAALAAVPSSPRLLYARVDLVPGPSGPQVLEVELCEPSLFLGFSEGAADRFADAIARRVGDR